MKIKIPTSIQQLLKFKYEIQKSIKTQSAFNQFKRNHNLVFKINSSGGTINNYRISSGSNYRIIGEVSNKNNSCIINSGGGCRISRPFSSCNSTTQLSVEKGVGRWLFGLRKGLAVG